MIIPGFIPWTLHEWVALDPSATNWNVIVGICAGELMGDPLLLMVAIPVFSGQASPQKS